MTTIVPDMSILLSHEVAFRITEKRFQPDSRVILANIHNGFGDDVMFFFANALGYAAPLGGNPMTEYRPYKKRTGEPESGQMLETYAPTMLQSSEKRNIERRLGALVLADPDDDINRIRIFPGGQLPKKMEEPDLDAIATQAKALYIDDTTIRARLEQQYETEHVVINLLQVILYRLEIGKSGSNFKTRDFSSIKATKRYLETIA